MNKPKDPQEVYEFIGKVLKEKYGSCVRYEYPDGKLDDANKMPSGAGISVDCEDMPYGTEVWIKVGYFI